MRRKWTQDEHFILKTRYEQEGELALSRELDRTPASVGSEARRLGIKANRQLRYRRMGDSLKQHNPKNTEFFKIWTSEMAYTIGYIWADGSIQNTSVLKLDCNTEDEEVILKIAEWLQSNNKITREPEKTFIQNGKQVHSKPKTKTSICSVEMVQDLNGIGIFSRKSYRDDPFPRVPEGLLRDFVRGYFDGDGCPSSTKITYLGSPQFIKGMQEEISKQTGVPKHKIHQQERIRKIIWGAAGDVERLFDWMYIGVNFYLKRKHEVLKEYLESELFQWKKHGRGRNRNRPRTLSRWEVLR